MGFIAGLVRKGYAVVRSVARFAAVPARAGIPYVSNGNNTIEGFTPGGVASVFANSGLSFPASLAFTNDAGVPLALPPGTAALLPAALPAGLLALGGTSQWVRRSRRQAI